MAEEMALAGKFLIETKDFDPSAGLFPLLSAMRLWGSQQSVFLPTPFLSGKWCLSLREMQTLFWAWFLSLAPVAPSWTCMRANKMILSTQLPAKGLSHQVSWHDVDDTRRYCVTMLMLFFAMGFGHSEGERTLTVCLVTTRCHSSDDPF